MLLTTCAVAVALTGGAPQPHQTPNPLVLQVEDKAAAALGERTIRFIEVFTPAKKAELAKIAAYENTIEPDDQPNLMDAPELDAKKLEALAAQLAESERKAAGLAQVIAKARSETVDKLRASAAAIGNADFARGAADGVAERYQAQAAQQQKMTDAMVTFYRTKRAAVLWLIAHQDGYTIEDGDVVFDEQGDADAFKAMAMESHKASQAFHAIHDNAPE